MSITDLHGASLSAEKSDSHVASVQEYTEGDGVVPKPMALRDLVFDEHCLEVKFEHAASIVLDCTTSTLGDDKSDAVMGWNIKDGRHNCLNGGENCVEK